jgi:hypothetical protein
MIFLSQSCEISSPIPFSFTEFRMTSYYIPFTKLSDHGLDQIAHIRRTGSLHCCSANVRVHVSMILALCTFLNRMHRCLENLNYAFPKGLAISCYLQRLCELFSIAVVEEYIDEDQVRYEI